MRDVIFRFEKFLKCLSERINSVRVYIIRAYLTGKKISWVLFMLRLPFEVLLKAWKMHSAILLFIVMRHAFSVYEKLSKCFSGSQWTEITSTEYARKHRCKKIIIRVLSRLEKPFEVL